MERYSIGVLPYIYGNVPVFKLLLNIIDKGFTKAESHIFIILTEISTWAFALLMFKALLILMIS